MLHNLMCCYGPRDRENCGDLPERRGLRPFDAEEFRENAHKVVDFIADYYRDIEKFPVRSQIQACFFLKPLEF